MVRKTSQNYYEKIAKLVAMLGVDWLRARLPAGASDPETCRALLAKDPNLNNIPLIVWDRCVDPTWGKGRFERRSSRDLPSTEPFVARWREQGCPAAVLRLSVADCVGALKHVAIYHVAGATPEFE